MAFPPVEKITLSDITVSSRTVWRHVVVEDADGLAGLGEGTCHEAGGDLPAALLQFGSMLLGKAGVTTSLAPYRSTLFEGLLPATVYSAYEQALVDLEAQRAGRSIRAHLCSDAANNLPVRLYANINRRTEQRTPANCGKSAGEALSAGFDAIKFAPFDGLTPELCGTEEGKRLIREGLDRLAGIAAAISGRAELMVDCHWRFSVAGAMDAIPALKELGVCWFECPLPETVSNIEALVRLRSIANEAGMRLAGLETVAGWEGFKPFVEAGAYDIVMPDVKHAGGFRDIIEIADRSRALGTAVSLHNPTGPAAHVASVHLASLFGAAERLEIQWDESPLFFDLVDPAPVISNACCEIPDGDGLGVKLRHEEHWAVRERVLVANELA